MTKVLRKAMMKRSELEHKCVIYKTNENLNSYKERGIFAVNYINKRKKLYKVQSKEYD